MKVHLTNHGTFNASLLNILSYSYRPLEVVMKEQAKGIVGKVISVTPPAGRGGVAGAKAKGEKTVKSQIGNVLMGVPARVAKAAPKHALTIDEARRHHFAARRKGRITRQRKHKDKIRVPAALLKRYVKEQQGEVGKLADGWGAAARKLGVPTTIYKSWMSRHRSPSLVNIKVNKKGIRIRFTNSVRYVTDVDVMTRRLDWALARQARANDARVMSAVRAGVRQAGWHLT